MGGAVVVPMFCFYIWLFPYWVTRLRAASRAIPEDLGANSLQFQRIELTRQRDALRTGWLWYLGPLLPGLVVFMWGIQGGSARRFEVLVDLTMLAVFVVVIWISRRGAAKMQRRIDALDALVEPAAKGSV
ncbi:MAG TPA: hypothetical protein VHW25_13630 [Steroidobacteraceae bacterium]|nr:hypothetical protein [Steroidobacteraceae bacterium]